jgi:hypothetical protein
MNLKSSPIFRSTIALAGLALTTSLTLWSTSVKALTLVTDRTALNANDLLDFSTVGEPFNPLQPNPQSFLPNSINANSANGLGLNINIAPSTNPAISPPFVLQTGAPPTSIPTNFANGDYVLFTGADVRSFPATGNSGPVTINFDTPVQSAGTQIAVDDTFTFDASVSAFDSGGNLLGTFSAPGTSSTNLDNSALFLGVSSDSANISRLVYNTSIPDRAIGINALSINSNGITNHNTTNKVPEPYSLFGLAIALTSGISCLSRKHSTT